MDTPTVRDLVTVLLRSCANARRGRRMYAFNSPRRCLAWAFVRSISYCRPSSPNRTVFCSDSPATSATKTIPSSYAICLPLLSESHLRSEPIHFFRRHRRILSDTAPVMEVLSARGLLFFCSHVVAVAARGSGAKSVTMQGSSIQSAQAPFRTAALTRLVREEPSGITLAAIDSARVLRGGAFLRVPRIPEPV